MVYVPGNKRLLGVAPFDRTGKWVCRMLTFAFVPCVPLAAIFTKNATHNWSKMWLRGAAVGVKFAHSPPKTGSRMVYVRQGGRPGTLPQGYRIPPYWCNIEGYTGELGTPNPDRFCALGRNRKLCFCWIFMDFWGGQILMSDPVVLKLYS